VHNLHVLATDTVLAAAAEGEHNPLFPPVGEIIFGGIAFLVLYWMASRFVFPPVMKALDERRDNIQGQLERAERERRDASELLERYRQQIDGAQAEADQIIAEAHRRAEEVRQDIIARAEEDAARRIARAETQIAAERDRAVGEVRRDVGQLAVTLAERIIGEQMSADRQQSLVDRFVDELATTGAGERPSGEEAHA
jgi:F-type H+-transporting ATPase subunit b